jgi:S2P endopeptidase
MLPEQHQFSFKPFRLNWRTTVFNKYLFDFTHQQIPLYVWYWWFRFGATIALCTTLAGTCIVIRSSFELGQILYTYRSLLFSSNSIEKRNFRILSRKKQSSLLPMIPGLTLPLNHAHYYFFALLLCTLFHELGHGLCASVYEIPIQDIGIFINYIYPGAFISISQSDLSDLSRWRRLQVVCAGIWHNLILYSCCKLFNWLSEFIWACIGWKNIEQEGGVSVVGIHQHSPLYRLITPGSRITQLNDIPIIRGQEDWKTFWNSDFTQPLEKGFCASANQGNTQCCEFTGDLPFGNSTDPMVSCFQDKNLGDEAIVDGRCLSTLEVLASKETRRCSTDSDCYGNTTCVVPVTPSVFGQSVRIFSETNNKRETMITIYEGALRDVLDSGKKSFFSYEAKQVDLIFCYSASE